MVDFPFLTLILAVGASIAAIAIWLKALQLRRAEFIRTYRWPPGLLDKLGSKYATLKRKDAALVSRGLRQFFLAHLMSGRKYAAMPSQVADDLWHEFILYTREYERFCSKAFGAFLHHTPAAALAPDQKNSNEGLRRVWWYTCKYENIDARNPTRLPLLFALDGKLEIPNGYRYHPNCEQLRRSGVAGTHCGGDFASVSFDGGTDGFGDGAGGGGGGDGGDGGGGCGGD